MPQAKFVLKEPNASNETLIYLFFNYSGQRLKYSFNEKIHPKYWNAKKQRANAKLDGYAEFNTRLNNIEAEVQEIFRKLINDKIEPTTDKLRDELNNRLSHVIKEKKQNLFEFIESFISEVSNNRRKGSIQIYKTTLKHLKEFSVSKKIKLDFDAITLSFYNDFSDYLITKGMVTNTLGKYIKLLKHF